MSHRASRSDDPKIQAYIEKASKRDHRMEHIFRRILYVLERFIAGITLIALMGALFMEILQMATTGSAYFTDVNHLLHNLLNIVVGIEFVRMIIDTTPANILEVLTVAITRHVILNHSDPWSNAVCVACIAGLFAIRRFLIGKKELKEEMVEMD